MRRLGESRKMKKKKHSWASWAKLTNLARWWVQSPKWYSTAWRLLGRSRWGLTKWGNRDRWMRSTTSVTWLSNTGQLIWKFWQLWSPKQTRLQSHHRWQHLESSWRHLMLSLDNHKCHYWLHDKDVVKLGWVPRKHCRTASQHLSCMTRCLIHHRLWTESLLKP